MLLQVDGLAPPKGARPFSLGGCVPDRRPVPPARGGAGVSGRVRQSRHPPYTTGLAGRPRRFLRVYGLTAVEEFCAVTRVHVLAWRAHLEM